MPSCVASVDLSITFCPSTYLCLSGNAAVLCVDGISIAYGRRNVPPLLCLCKPGMKSREPITNHPSASTDADSSTPATWPGAASEDRHSGAGVSSGEKESSPLPRAAVRAEGRAQAPESRREWQRRGASTKEARETRTEPAAAGH